MNALIVVDIQNDFLPGGALAVPRGDEVVPVVNQLMALCDVVAATQDWHPADHGSFACNHPGRKPGDRVMLGGVDQILWPVHCVQETTGAAFSAALNTPRIDAVFRKGTDPQVDSYSGFFDNGRRHASGLEGFLRNRGVSQVFIAGLATDYCVKFTALDALALGFDTHVVQDACRGVNLTPGDVDVAIREVAEAGVRIVKAREVNSRQ